MYHCSHREILATESSLYNFYYPTIKLCKETLGQVVSFSVTLDFGLPLETKQALYMALIEYDIS